MLLLPLLFATAGEAFAQVWHQERDNGILNVQSGSASPLSLYHNPTEAWNAASASWLYSNGEFHRPDRPSGQKELDLSVEELGTLGKFRTSGSLRYRNTRDINRNWNSLIGNDPDNPYIICDTLADNSVTERFDIGGAITWQFSDNWIAGGQIGLTTATLSDNKDPRPKNDISRIPVTFGLEHRFGSGWSAGFFGGTEVFSSKFTNYLEYGQKTYRYYKMKGMGDYFAFSSSESSSAPREYFGLTYSAGANVGVARNSFENFTELGFSSGYENARDGGSAHEWKAGDYSFTRITFHERIDLKGELRQSISLNADIKLIQGFWYDQKVKIDTEHGNISYYEVMSRYKNNDATRIVADACYRIGKDKSWNAGLGVRFLSENDTHFADGEACIQAWNQLGVNAEGWKTLNLGSNVLDISAGAGYILPLGEPEYATGNTAIAKDDITKCYVDPVFAYETSGKLSAFFRADWVFAPVKGMRPCLFAKGAILKQMGSASQYPSLEGTSFCSLTAGAVLTF